jgi:DNA invertase Pin-like site-specific DNA recombinase
MTAQHLIGYARVSSQGQNLDTQIDRLTQYGCNKLFSEKFTGAKADREQLNIALEYIREDDALVVTKLDRLARSAVDLGKIAEQLQRKKVDLIVLDQQIDTTTPTGKLMFTMIGAFAEFERDLIAERCQEGIAKAKAKGVRFGRPVKLTDAEIQSLKLEFESGGDRRSELARRYGISTASLYRIVRSK